MQGSTLTLLLLSLTTVLQAAPTPTEDYTRREVLEGPDKYVVHWRYNDTHIVFEVHAHTRGYVGFGLSPNGGMAGSDIVIGGIRNGKPYIEDRHAVGNSKPILDTSQDLLLLAAKQETGYTLLKFSRRLRSCDPNDRNITTDTARLIWAYSDSSDLSYHGNTNRGTKSVLLLSSGSKGRQLPADSYTLDFTMNNIQLPSTDTAYFCRAFRIPRNITAKHHIIRVDPIITPGNEKVVHHILLLACHDTVDDNHHGEQYECQSFSETPSSKCYSLIAAWAIGSPIFWYPEDVGLALGDGHITFLRIQMHYDNPTIRSDIVDSSGLRLFMTATPRRHDAGVIQAGVIPDDNLVIPPGQQEFMLRGWCMQECMQRMKDTHPDGINVFATGLHTHLIGTKVRLRHIRNGKELKPIATDENYDFDFQTFINVIPNTKVMWTDSILTECVYSSTNRPEITPGGEGTKQEMCNAFVLYYPRMDFSVCVSVPRPITILNAVPGVQAQATRQRPFFDITGPPQYVGKSKQEVLQSVDWTDTAIAANFQNKTLDGDILYSCQYSFGVVKAPQITQPYVKVEPPCGINSYTSGNERDYTRSIILEAPDRYVVSWRYSIDRVVFEVKVKTRGFIGFGFTPNGGMKGSDIAIMGFRDAQPYIKDYFAYGNSEPKLDDMQDWHLISASQNGEYTMVNFWRHLMTCGSMDRNITKGTMKLIWSYSDSPSLTYHGAVHRGSKSVLLLNEEPERQALPADAFPLDIKFDKINISSDATTYWCKVFELPATLDTMHHLIESVPIIQAGNEKLVHHIVLTECEALNVGQEHVPHSAYKCPPIFGLDEPVTKCYNVIVGWAVGGPDFVYPPDVGLPLSRSRNKYLRLQVHYDNPTHRTDYIDSSGIRLWLTPTLRRHNAGVLNPGLIPNKQTIIPPHQSALKLQGWCLHKCRQKRGEVLPPGGIQVFSVMLHTHLLGIGARVRHFRNGTELPPIATDDHYDFNFQSYQSTVPHVTILPDDDFVIECVYNSEGKTNITLGGESTNEEMCMAFIVYYPALEFSTCVSQATQSGILNSLLGVQTRGLNKYPYVEVINPPEYVGKSLLEVVSDMDWKNQTVSRYYQDHINTGRVDSSCVYYSRQEVPTIVQEYTEETPGYLHPGQCVAGREYTRRVILEAPDRYVVSWRYSIDRVVFEVKVKTRGFVGFGFTPNGGMKGSDIAIMGFRDAQPYIKDYFAYGNSEPKLDDMQDWRLISASQDGEYTTVNFWRHLMTCDSMDRNITKGTMKLIWSYSDSPSLTYHGAVHRGSKSVLLLNEEPESQALPADAFPLDIKFDKINISSDATTYWCKVFELPATLDTMHHLIKSVPIIQTGNEKLVHHIVLTECEALKEGQEHVPHSGYKCPPVFGHDEPVTKCYNVIVGWAVGGPDFVYPPDVGLPLSRSRNKYLRLQVHYDNPTHRTDYIDSSGIRLWLTPTLRQHNAGVLLPGLIPNKQTIIPPHQSALKLQGWCLHKCRQKRGDLLPPGGIQVFSVMLHTHLLGISARVRHFRNGTELPPIATDDHYDFNFQSYQSTVPHVTILPDDDFVVECVYNSEGKTNITLGGESTNEEMCMAFIVYYPALEFSNCLSQATRSGVLNSLLGVQTRGLNKYPYVEVINPPEYIGKSLLEVVSDMDWKNQTVSRYYQDHINTGRVDSSCVYYSSLEVPTIVQEYTEQTPGYLHPGQCVAGSWPEPSEQYEHMVELVVNVFRLYWKDTDDVITFEVHTRTAGVVGLGVAPRQVQWPFNAPGYTDWFMGSTSALFSDYHSDGDRKLVKDAQQDWTLISHHVTDGVNKVKVSRPLKTCDRGYDQDIGAGSTNVMWMYSVDDGPAISGVDTARVVQGMKSLNLLNPPIPLTMSPDTMAYEFELSEFKKDVVGTVILCQDFPIPVTKKNHIIKLQGLVRPANQAMVIYIVLYGCKSVPGSSDNTKTFRPYPHQCFADTSCDTFLFAWNMMGDTYFDALPNNVGLPIGDGSYDFIKVHAHYETRGAKIDYSGTGFRVWVTPTLRKHDAGWLLNGLPVSDLHIVPPHYEDFVSQGHCIQPCIEKMVSKASGGINIVGVIQHAHFSAKEIRTRHYRDNKELPPIAYNNNFNMLNQEFTYFKQPVNIKKTDRLMTECVYDTAKLQKILLGINPHGEMCLSYMLYYPKLDMSHCFSQPDNQALLQLMSQGQSVPKNMETLRAADYAQTLPWYSKSYRDMFQEDSLKADIQVYCDIMAPQKSSPPVPVPETVSSYSLPAHECPQDTEPAVNNGATRPLFYSLVQLFSVSTCIVLIHLSV